jgi:hypothetical protein
MRDVNLALFDFDYDLTWMGFFLSPDERIYGRYGGRDATSADGRVSLEGLRFALEAALRRHRSETSISSAVSSRKPFTVSEFPASRSLPANACVHCHQVYDLRRESLQVAHKWSLDEVWVYPQPENIGLALDVDRGDRVGNVVERSPAARCGIRAGDRLTKINEEKIASISDVQYALHRCRTARKIEVHWTRDDRAMSATLLLPEGWHKTDLSWRRSLRGLDPAPPVRGEDLNSAEKEALGLRANRLAFRQGPFVSPAAEQAGVRQNDVITGVDGRDLAMTERQFGAYVRLNYHVGDRVTLNLLRAGRKIDATLTLPGR